MAENKERNAADAYNNVNTTIKATKRQDLSLGTPNNKQPTTQQNNKETQQSTDISGKLKRIYDILGSSSLGASATRKRMNEIRNTDINLYMELIELANDISNHYTAQHPITKGSIDFGEAENPKTLAERILTADKSVSVPGINLGFGGSKLQDTAINNYKTATNTILNNIQTYMPVDMVKALHTIQDYNMYEWRLYNIISNTAGNDAIKAQSYKRLEDYARMWKMCQDRINTSFMTNVELGFDFMSALLDNPPAEIQVPNGFNSIEHYNNFVKSGKSWYDANVKDIEQAKKTASAISDNVINEYNLVQQ